MSYLVLARKRLGFWFPVLCLYDKAGEWHLPWKRSKLIYVNRKKKKKSQKKRLMLSYTTWQYAFINVTNISFHSTIQTSKWEQIKTRRYQVLPMLLRVTAITLHLCGTLPMLPQNAPGCPQAQVVDLHSNWNFKAHCIWKLINTHTSTLIPATSVLT